MNDRTDEANVPREPWQRLLEDPAEGPPETTDARIRAAARRDLVPRGQRWWLPASLAASFVLAVLVVRSEFGGSFRIPPPAHTQDGSAAIDGRILDRSEDAAPREAGRLAAAANARSKAVPRVDAEPDAYGYAENEVGRDEAGQGPAIGGPERELKSASEMPEERVGFEGAPPSDERRQYEAPAPAATAAAAPAAPAPAPAARADSALNSVVVTGTRRESTEQGVPTEPSSWTPAHVAAPVDNVKAQSAGALAPPPTPEAWYAAIEKLRREGRKADAERELERLKKAYPGWLEEHLAKTPR